MTDKEFKCEKCDKEFSSKDALDMHNNSKHYSSSQNAGVKNLKKMDKKKVRNWLIILAVVIVIIVVAYVMAIKPAAADDKYDGFAQCLSGNNVTMYGAWWCSHCKAQKEAFGKSFQYINYVECSTPDGNAMLKICQDIGIEGYPTWEFSNGERKEGFVPLEELAFAGNCTLPN